MAKNIKKIFGREYEIVDESWYSSLKANQRRCLNEVYRQILPKKMKCIVDCTAHIGCDAINFQSLFRCEVIAIDINREALECMQRNIQKYSIPSKYQLIEGDVVEWIEKYGEKADLYYFDPPWGGKDYINKDKIQLVLSDRDIGDVVSLVKDRELTKNICIKVPSNFDFDHFNDKIETYDVYDIYTTHDKLVYKIIHIKLSI